MSEAPAQVREYAEQAVAYVQRAVGVALEYDSNTLPLLDHYLRAPEIATGPVEATQLVVATAGAYFGEVVRLTLGGRWELPAVATDDKHARTGAEGWRMVLPTGISFSPTGFVAAAIARADLADLDTEMTAPPRILPHLESALARMGELTVEDYYSLCGRLDTLEHVHEVLVAVAAQLMGNAEGAAAADADPDLDLNDGSEGPGRPDFVVPVSDEPSGPLN